MPTASGTSVFLARGVVKHTWTLTSTASVGRPATLSRFPDKTVHVRGVFSGASVSIFGGNQSATAGTLVTGAGANNVAVLNDSRGEGNAATFTAANAVVLLENPNIILPKITALGTAAPARSIIVEIVAQSTRR